MGLRLCKHAQKKGQNFILIIHRTTELFKKKNMDHFCEIIWCLNKVCLKYWGLIATFCANH